MNGLGRRPDGENRDEPEGTATGRSAGASEEQRAEAWQCGTRERASQAGEISPTGDEAGAGEVWGGRRRAIWADAGGRTFRERRRDADRRGDAAAVDASRRAVESAAEAETVSAAARTTAALWGVGADGWKFSRLVGGARSGRMHDEHDRRCDQ